MENVTRIKPGPHRPPRPGDREPLPGRFEQLPVDLRTKIVLGGAAAFLALSLVAGGVVELGRHQREGVSKAPVPTESDYKAQDQQLNGN